MRARCSADNKRAVSELSVCLLWDIPDVEMLADFMKPNTSPPLHTGVLVIVDMIIQLMANTKQYKCDLLKKN